MHVSPDITVNLAGQLVADEGVAKDNLQGSVTLEVLGLLPPNADITAYQLLPNSNSLFSLDTAVTLTGGVAVSPDDVVRFDGSTFNLEYHLQE